MRALISGAVYFLPSISMDQSLPMCRLTERTVRSTLVTAWFLAGWPTSTSPLRANATIDGVVLEPSELATTTGSPPSRTETTELVVPRSIPTARAMVNPPEYVELLSCTMMSAPRSSLPRRRCAVNSELSLMHSTY
ncbi:Uncharacterised protein [Mycobacterium tuberculosis]|uniref:Uncharacterized protein n=1 Tax=Mycobacterium tuberculosis TaxID=1773 RepID=A0A654U012_MYCTX|nr:Uncharacterised protein [Mycobacterium tuberculosis]CFR78769.1 Uncharacterised protein [Mycobacterium tuberculosis]COV85376.1 Uncharacterised protein [Mycobacterium tuberculosis]COW26601.1 Uncharacterised protein [Mycobacterium tuberculosis]COW39739.1 Uncharacterised protein [Mycobacterium tuberculosis]